MDYIGILKRAWEVAWKHKILWLFGLFAGTAGSGLPSGSGSGGGGSADAGWDPEGVRRALDVARPQIEQALPIVVSLAVLFILVGLVFFVLSIAAQGGLVHLVNEAEERRPVKAGDGWRVGFGRWARVFLLNLLVGLPILALTAVYALLNLSVFIAIVGAAVGGSDLGSALGAAGVGTFCCSSVLYSVAALVLSVVLGIAGQLGLRYAILDDMSAWTALKQGWADVWAKRGGFLMLVLMMVAGIAYGVAVAVLLGVPFAMAVVALLLGNVFGFVALVVLAALLAMLPGAVYGAFHSAAWTVFFRRMTGREPGFAVTQAPVAPPEPPAAPEVWSAANEIPAAPPAPPEPPAGP